MAVTPESQKYGRYFIVFGLAVLALGAFLAFSLSLLYGGGIDFKVIEVIALTLVSIAMIPLVVVMFGQAAQ